MSEQQPEHMDWAMVKSPFIRQMYQKTERNGVGIGTGPYRHEQENIFGENGLSKLSFSLTCDFIAYI